MHPFFFKIVHYVDKTESFVGMSYFLKIAVLSPILSTKRLSTTALLFKQSMKINSDPPILYHGFNSVFIPNDTCHIPWFFAHCEIPNSLTGRRVELNYILK